MTHTCFIAARSPGASTPFPSYLLDTIMPTLTDTEWRLLCVVVRATLGWTGAQNGQRKTHDWLTQSQLKVRTGRASEAISRAIDSLVRQELIEVKSDMGVFLATPESRRAHQGHLLFSLGPRAHSGVRTLKEKANLPTFTAAAEERRRVHGGASSLLGQHYSPSELRQAKTTKETIDKTTQKGTLVSGQTPRQAMDTSATLDADPLERRAPTSQSVSQVHAFLEEYQALFCKHSARGEPPPINWGKDGTLVKGLLTQYEYARLLELLRLFFQSTDPWVRKRGYALSCFLTLLPQLLMGEGQRREMPRRAPATPVANPPPTKRNWSHATEAPPSSLSLFERYPELARKVRDHAL